VIDGTVIDGMGTARARCVLAPNPSPMTLDGTNTWILAEPGSPRAVVVDPGPAHAGHLHRVRDQVAAAGQRVAQILLTHSHPDHAEGAEIRVVATPGHSADSVCLHLPADGALLTGDTVLGRGTTVIAGDGNLTAYLESLDRLRQLTDQAGLTALLPGHGPMLSDPGATLDYYISHRHERLAEVQAALDAGDRTPDEIVARIYRDVDRALWPYAAFSVRAALQYLADQGALRPGVKQ
jgi:glyoxylase-like metal-dependent hydrolase (beta-lactamase superfamily II)